MVTKEPLIEISDLYFNYPEEPFFFNGLDLVVYEGERIALCGDNGAGKTSLFLAMLGLLPIKKGNIKFWGKKYLEKDFVSLRKRVGLLFQDPDDQLFCPSVLEDVAFGLMNLGFSQEEARNKGEAVLETLGIAHLSNKVPYKLSGGEKRMASLATILAMEPEILLLDEPTTGLSKKYVQKLVDVLEQCSAKAMIIISHDQAFIDTIANRKVELKAGKILAE